MGEMTLERAFDVDLLRVNVFQTRREMGETAARDIAAEINRVLSRKENCNIIFAAAPSQNEVLEALASFDGIEWNRVGAFHMDEYIGLSPDAPQGFANFLRAALFDRVPFGMVQCINCAAEPEAECRRYAEILREYPADIVIMGVGENGHIAFNDPHVAMFEDPEVVKAVELDEVCRRQQVHDGCFATLADVPKTALTLTIPTLVAPEKIFCIVPGPTKANAICTALTGGVSEECPASVLRRHPNATLYLDADSAALL